MPTFPILKHYKPKYKQMKILKISILLLVVALTFSCSKSEDQPKPDFSVLGLSSFTINGVAVDVKNTCLSSSSNELLFTASRTENNLNLRSFKAWYVIFTKKGVQPSVSASSIYPDATITVTKKDNFNNMETYSVEVKRDGYKEVGTYFLSFKILEPKTAAQIQG